MRMLKKLLLAGAFIGVLGSFGFAQEAKADTLNTSKISGDVLSYTVTSTISNNSISILIDGIDTGYVKTVSVDTVSDNSIELSKLVNGANINQFKSKASVSTVTIKTKGGLNENVAGMNPMYRLVGQSNNEFWGSVTVDSKALLFDYDKDHGGQSHVVKAVPTSTSYKFSKWDDGDTDKTGSRTVYATNGAAIAATFVEAPKVPNGTLYATVTEGGVTVAQYNSAEVTEFVMKRGQKVTFGVKFDVAGKYNGHYEVSQYETYLKLPKDTTSTATWEAVKETGTEDYATATCVPKTEGEFTCDDLDVYVIGSTAAASKVSLTDFKEYITEGYTLEFKGKAANETTDLTLVISEGKDYVDSVDRTQNTSDKNVTFKIKFKDEKQDKGTNSKDVKFKIMVGGESGTPCTIDSDTEKEKKVTVYSNPTNSYNNSDRTMSYKVPAKVNTGTESGKDSNLSYTQDTVSDVKGIRINVLLNDNILGTTTTASGKGTGATVDAATMESIITNLGNSGKFTGDCTVVFRAYPSDGSGNCNKKVYHDTYAKVYKVVLRPGQSATAGAKTASAYALPIAMIAQRNTGATTTTATTTTAAGKEYVLYGLEGQTLTAPTGVTDLVDANGNAVTKIVVSADANKNVYTYAATASAATKEGLDKVPKTGQSNVFVYVMAVVICGAVGYGLYAYNKKSKKSI